MTCWNAVSHAAQREIEQKVLKTISILELLKDRSGLAADFDTLALALHEIDRPMIEVALARLELQSEVVFRKHSRTFVLYAGSDFDVEARLAEILSEKRTVDLDLVRTLADLQPMLAKRHHRETGAMRWFDMSIEPVSALEELASCSHSRDIVGRIVFPLPIDGEEPNEIESAYKQAGRAHDAFPLMIGHHVGAIRLLELARELEGLNSLESRFPELRGDSIARREIDARGTEVRERLEGMLNRFIGECLWYQAGQRPQKLTKRQLNERLSSIADAKFPDAPHIRNELLNCSEPSSNAVSARTKLMKRMAIRGADRDLGFAGKHYPAERGLYITLLQETGIHCDGQFRAPSEGDVLFPLWREADQLLEASESGVVTADEVIRTWSDRPIGLKAGLGPVFVVAYAFSRRDRVAVYGEGVFQSSFNELCVEFLARDTRDIGLRRVEMEGFIGETLKALGALFNLDGKIEPLAVARKIIGEFDALVPWTARTQSLSPQTLQVRDILKRASDPNKLLFDDLPRLTEPMPDGNFDVAATAILLRDALAEMRAAYPKVLDELKDLMLRELDVRNHGDSALKNLRDRADNIRQIGGDLRLEAFVGRLTQFHGTREDMEGIASVAVNKLPRVWNDGDRERAAVGLVELATSFLKTESLARVKGRKDRRHALAVVLGKEDMPHSLFKEFEVSDVDRDDVARLAETLNRALSKADHQNREIVLAALIEVTSSYLNARDEHSVGVQA